MASARPSLPAAFRTYRFHSCSRHHDGQWSTLIAGITPKTQPAPPEWQPPLQRWQLHLVLAGRITVHIDGQTLGDYGPGDWIRAKPGSQLTSYPDCSSDFVEAVFIVNGSIAPAMQDGGVLPATSRCGHGRLSANSFATVARLLAAVKQAGRDSAQIWPLAAIAQFAQELEQAAAPELEPDPVLEAACRALTDWLHPCGMEVLARRLDVSPAELRRRFDQRFGCTPRRWRTSERLRQACDLLLEDNSVAVIAARLGFSDAMEFSKQFRSAMGCPPSRWTR